MLYSTRFDNSPSTAQHPPSTTYENNAAFIMADNPLFGGNAPDFCGRKSLAELTEEVCSVIVMVVAPHCLTHSSCTQMPSMISEVATKKGLLWRKDKETGMGRNPKWHLHWFELRDTFLSCFTSVPDTAQAWSYSLIAPLTPDQNVECS